MDKSKGSNEFSACDRLYLARPQGEHLKGTKRSSNFFLSPFRKRLSMLLGYQLIKGENEMKCNTFIPVVIRTDTQNMKTKRRENGFGLKKLFCLDRDEAERQP